MLPRSSNEKRKKNSGRTLMLSLLAIIVVVAVVTLLVSSNVGDTSTSKSRNRQKRVPSVATDDSQTAGQKASSTDDSIIARKSRTLVAEAGEELRKLRAELEAQQAQIAQRQAELEAEIQSERMRLDAERASIEAASKQGGQPVQVDPVLSRINDLERRASMQLELDKKENSNGQNDAERKRRQFEVAQDSLRRQDEQRRAAEAAANALRAQQLEAAREAEQRREQMLKKQKDDADSLRRRQAEIDAAQADLERRRRQQQQSAAGSGGNSGSGGLPEEERKRRQQSVKEGFLHAWNNYKRYAWGKDELEPVTKRGKDWLGLAATIIDSLDTLWIMGLKSDFDEAREYVATRMSFDIQRSVSVFETCIRDLGGLLAAYELSRDPMFLVKAEDLGWRLLKAFDTPSGLPYATINLKTGRGSSPSWTGGASILSEMGTMQLEFTYLAHHTGKPELAARVNDVFRKLDKLHKPKSGLYPLFLDVNSGRFRGQQVSTGALGDSFYEYLVKMWLFTGKSAPGFRRMYDEAATGIATQLVQHSTPSNLAYVAELNQGGAIHHKMDELVCFIGGMYALGAAGGPNAERDLQLGRDLTETCYQFWHRQPTGIAPELVTFSGGRDFAPGSRAHHYLLRPETVESLFVLYRVTGDVRYQEQGWEIWQAINKHCRTPDGFSGIRDVTNANNPQWDNTQQSFFLAETLKYLYLLFSPVDLIPLDQYVFNTEAHVLGIINNHNFPSTFTQHFPDP
jgi:mannosyl-oligosaccharide alpha-1,2-mannosidase